MKSIVMIKQLSTLIVAVFLALGVTGGVSAGESETSAVKQQESSKEVLAAKQQTSSETVNINSASLEELQSLKGIGLVKAKAIIEYREHNGKFTSLDQLTQVSGIGDRFVEHNADKISF